MIGGIDLGGTKIEARLFDGAGAETVAVHRVPTPQESFAAMLEALSAQVDWLCRRAGDPALPVGVSVPGLIDPQTGESFASNIPSTGHPIAAALEAAQGRALPVVNDCMAFAYSEARGGAGGDARSVMGLILGTGVGGGIILEGEIPHRHAGLAVEIGHVGISSRALARHDLPLWRCGCGQLGCMELYTSGTGVANLAEHFTGRRLGAEGLAQEGTAEAERILATWADLAGDCLYTIQLMLDPDCIVIGGGLSNMAGITDRLSASLARLRLGQARLPDIRIAQHGDSSGARGAALLATT